MSSSAVMLSALYEAYPNAVNTVRILEAEGLSPEQISVVTMHPGEHAIYSALGVREVLPDSDEAEVVDAAKQGTTGAILGGTVGAAIALSAFAVPGISDVVGAGWMVAFLAGAAFGGAAGLASALIGHGTTEKHAEDFIESVREGDTLVAVKTDLANAARVRTMLAQLSAPEDMLEEAA